MNKKKQFAQYFTPSAIANVLATRAMSFLSEKPKKVLELAAGDGQLLISLIDIAPACQPFAVDIDIDNINNLIEKYPTFECIHFDALDELLPIPNSDFDLALANPPFISNIVIDSYKQEILKEYLDMVTNVGDTIRSEILFICQYLKHLKTEKILSMILPSSLISGDRHRAFRSALIKKYELLEVYQVLDCEFLDTEADTYIITLCNSKPKTKKLPLRIVNSRGDIISETKVKGSDLINRMDPKFYKFNENNGTTILGDVASIKRGNMTHKELKASEYNFIHTTNFSDLPELNKKEINNKVNNKHTIKNGDVIMCRVGKRIVGNTIEYKGPEIYFSDCIYRIHFSSNKKKKDFLNFTKSELGKSELFRLSKGVCSKYLTIGVVNNIRF